jgi:hypothetical protein
MPPTQRDLQHQLFDRRLKAPNHDMGKGAELMGPIDRGQHQVGGWVQGAEYRVQRLAQE